MDSYESFTKGVKNTNETLWTGQCRILLRVKNKDQFGVIPQFGKVMVAENRIESSGK